MSQSQHLSWNDAHFCGLRAQTNVYSLAESISHDGRNMLLAASIDGHLASIKFENRPFIRKVVPISHDDSLFNSACSGDNQGSVEETEVVSICVVHNWNCEGSSVLAVTFLKLAHFDEDKPPQAFMNIYLMVSTEEGCVKASDSLLQQIQLDFVPFKLTHHHIAKEDGCRETLMLLSGNNQKIHCYRPMADNKGYEEEEIGPYFPEMANIRDNVTQIEIKQLDNMYRLTALGTQNGLLTLSLVNIETREILDTWTSEMDSPITSLHFFNQHTNTQCPGFVKSKVSKNESNTEEEEDVLEEEPLHLVATSAIDPALVFHDIIVNGLSKWRVLPVSNSQDVVLCSCVMDVDFDGENEVLIGTYGQVILVYKLMYEKPQVLTSTPYYSPMPVPVHTNTPILSSERERPTKVDGKEVQDNLRRRHKTVAASCSETEVSSNERNKSEEGDAGEGNSHSHHALFSRLFRSQENLASPRSLHFETPDRTPDVSIPPYAMTPITDYPCYKLIWTRRFCNPVMGLACVDVMSDGLLDLVVLTLKGLHIMQPDLHEVASLILNRLKTVCNEQSETCPNK